MFSGFSPSPDSRFRVIYTHDINSFGGPVKHPGYVNSKDREVKVDYRSPIILDINIMSLSSS